MTVTIQDAEIELNAIKYPILSKVQPTLTSVFPEKRVFGDYSKDSDPIASTWSMDDWTGGMLVEELEETKHRNRYWWSSLDTRFKGHMLLRPYTVTATLPGNITVEAAIANGTMEAATSWTGGAQSAVEVYAGAASWAVTNGVGYQAATTWTTAWQGKTFTFTCWVWTAVASTGRISITDGVGTTYSTYHTGGSGWEHLAVSRTLDGSATKLQVQLDSETANVVYFDNAVLNSPVKGNIKAQGDFNDIHYIGYGQILAELDSAGTGFDAVHCLPAVITDLVVMGSILYIFHADGGYFYMDTDQELYGTNETSGMIAVVWDSKLVKVGTNTGICETATTPNASEPTWTACGTISTAKGTPESIATYRDASGNYIVYVATTGALWALDFDNTTWLETELALQSHPTCGKGMCHWHDALFVSAGLTVQKYIAGQTASIQDVGLDEDDGLPNIVTGEITKLTPGYDGVFACVDSTYEGATSYSQVLLYNGKSWHPWWSAAVVNTNVYSAAISDDTAYRLWIGVSEAGTDKIYYTALQRVKAHPKRISSYNYHSGGRLLTPWFDADWAAGVKLAIALKVKVSGLTTADESVVVTYRIDHDNYDYATGWTALDTITTADFSAASGIQTIEFASGAGLEFKSIQFRFVLARGTTTSNSPDIEWYSLSYLKNIPPRWGYQFTIDCTQSYNGRTSSQLLDALKTAAETGTLIAFSYRNDSGGTETYNGRIHTIAGEHHTGIVEKGRYSIFFVVP
jgi:hypothetical protein